MLLQIKEKQSSIWGCRRPLIIQPLIHPIRNDETAYLSVFLRTCLPALIAYDSSTRLGGCIANNVSGGARMAEKVQPKFPKTNMPAWLQWVLTTAVVAATHITITYGVFLRVTETWGSWIRYAMTMMCCAHSNSLWACCSAAPQLS